MSGCFLASEKPCATGHPVIMPVTCTRLGDLISFFYTSFSNLPIIGETFLSISDNGIQGTGVFNLS